MVVSQKISVAEYHVPASPGLMEMPRPFVMRYDQMYNHFILLSVIYGSSRLDARCFAITGHAEMACNILNDWPVSRCTIEASFIILYLFIPRIDNVSK